MFRSLVAPANPIFTTLAKLSLFTAPPMQSFAINILPITWKQPKKRLQHIHRAANLIRYPAFAGTFIPPGWALDQTQGRFYEMADNFNQ